MWRFWNGGGDIWGKCGAHVVHVVGYWWLTKAFDIIVGPVMRVVVVCRLRNEVHAHHASR